MRWCLGAIAGRHDIALLALIGLLYYLAAELALHMLSSTDGVAIYWPASGIACGAIALFGPRLRAPIVCLVTVATVVVNLHVRSAPALSSVFALSHGLECLLFGEFMRVLDRSGGRLERFSSVLSLLASAAATPAIAAVPAALATVWFAGSASHWSDIWFNWWKSHALGIVVVAPLIITLPSIFAERASRWVYLESAFVVCLAIVTAMLAFKRSFSGAAPVPTPATLLFPTFVWLAARTPPFISAATVFLMSAVIVMIALAGDGALGENAMPLQLRLATAQLAIATGAAALLTMSSMFAQVNNVAKALSTSEKSLRLALSAASMYAFEYDLARGTVTRAGKLAPRLGLTETGSFEQFRAAIHPDDLIAYDRLLARLSPAEPRLYRLLRMRTPQGDEIRVEYMSEGNFASDGRLQRLHGVLLDVTERERAREAFEAQSQRLNGALRAGRVLAFEYDVMRQVVTRTDNAAEIFGIPLEKALSSRNIFIDLVHPEDRAALIAYGTRKVPEEGSRRETFRFIRGDGGVAWLELTSTALFDKAGKLHSIRGLARDVTQEMRFSQRQRTLIRELDHRVKNALARMKVVIDISRRQHQSLDDYVDVIQGRIDSMARTQERLSRSRWTGVGIETLVVDELAAYRTEANCIIDGPPQLLAPEDAQGFAFTLHELATNAAKHGALSRPGGTVEVRWRLVDAAPAGRALHLTWHETVPGGVTAPTRESYGLVTIRNLLAHEQDAEVSVEFTPTGLHVSIELPLTWSAADPAAERDPEESIDVAVNGTAHRPLTGPI